MRTIVVQSLNIDDETMRLLREYHEYHGDGTVRCRGVVTLPTGGKMYLVHYHNERGIRCSSLDMIGYGADGPYATEMWSCERPDEQDMLREALEGDEVYADD